MPRGSAKPPEDGDESAMLFFFLAMLSCIVLPWGFSVLWSLLYPGRGDIAKEYPTVDEHGLRVRHCKTQAMVQRREAHMQELRSRWRKCTKGFVLRLAILLLLTCWLVYTVYQVRSVMATSALYQNFDPHEILGVARKDKSSAIKKAYHKLSLQYHPDKNSEPGAAEKFMLIKKAYDALTDPIARRNYERYGNPDGPTRMELGVALPTFSKENQGVVLVIFVVVFILGVPLTILACLGSMSSDVLPNGVLRATMEVLATKITASLDIKSAQALLLGSEESAACPERPGEAALLEELVKELKPTKAAAKKGAEEVGNAKAEALFLAHVQRKRSLLAEPMQRDLDELLPKWRLVALAMADLSARQGFAEALEAAVELHRCVVQALEPGKDAATLLQVPHFSVDRVKAWKTGARKTAGLPAFLELPADERASSLKVLAGFEPQELADANDFVAVAPRMAISEAKVFVDGEDGICEGDIATLSVSLKRANLQAEEAIGAAHTPLFPSSTVLEAWWLVFTISGGKGTKGAKGAKGSLARCKRLTAGGSEVTAEIKFKVANLGKTRCKISVLCESYTGLDLEQDVVFQATAMQRQEEAGDENDEAENDEDDDEDEDFPDAD